MKRLTTIVFTVLVSAGLFAQTGTEKNDNWFGHQSVEQVGTSWEDFQDRSGRAYFSAGPGYVGSSLAYFLNGGSNRLQYGLNVDLVTVFEGAQQRLTQAGYTVGQQESAFLVPFWLSMKFRITDNPFSKVAPYLITGAGPTLGLKFNDASSFSNIVNNVEGELGGGAYFGAGLDFLWMERWAISTDVRYNFIKFNDVLGLSDEYRGVSFSFGFIRAF